MEKILVRVASIDAMGAEIHSLEQEKPDAQIGLGGWKYSESSGCWWTRVKGEAVKKFDGRDYPTVVCDGNKIIAVE